MAKPYSRDLRGRLARAVLAGQSRREAARGFDAGASRAIKLMRRLRQQAVAGRESLAAMSGTRWPRMTTRRGR